MCQVDFIIYFKEQNQAGKIAIQKQGLNRKWGSLKGGKDAPIKLGFWCLFATRCLIASVPSIDTTIITTAISTMTREIRGDENFV